MILKLNITDSAIKFWSSIENIIGDHEYHDPADILPLQGRQRIRLHHLKDNPM